MTWLPDDRDSKQEATIIPLPRLESAPVSQDLSPAALAYAAPRAADIHLQPAERIGIIRHPPQTKEPAHSGKYAGSWTLGTAVGRRMRRAFRWDNVILRGLIERWPDHPNRR
jgi:hypothetical protein